MLSFYLVDRRFGALVCREYRVINQPVSRPVEAPEAPISMVTLWELAYRVIMLQVCGVGPNGIAPIAHIGVLQYGTTN